MPQSTVDASRDAKMDVCKRCSKNEADIVVRHEPLCNCCFVKYVESKIVKRMEGFRVRNAAPDKPRKLLLPVSFGVSSLVILHVLNQHRRRQLDRTGRQGYELHVFHVLNGNTEAALSNLQYLEQKYYGHVYHHPENVANDRFELLTSQKSATSCTDLYNVLRAHTIVEKAKHLGCEAVIWGHSTTRLAESIMAETAKGRGHSIPWLATDGGSFAGIVSIHPGKDLLRKELLSYWQALSLFEENLLTPVEEIVRNVSTRNASIDQLMNTYFSSIEENYPSIVANVLRTSGKLCRLSDDKPSPVCAICETPVPCGPTRSLFELGVDPSNAESKPNNGTVCYGCARSTSEVNQYRKR